MNKLTILILAFWCFLAANYSYAAYPGQNGKISFVSSRNGNFNIYVMNSDGSDQTNITNNSFTDQNPIWSPDGSKIAFESDRDNNGASREIYVMNGDGSGIIRLTNNSVDDHRPTWSPDGSQLAFERSGEIFIIKADGTNPQQITNNTVSDIAPSWSPSGTKIAFGRSISPSVHQILTMNIDGTGETNITNNSLLNYQPSWSPDGSKITYYVLDIGHSDIYVMNADGTNQINITNDISNYQLAPKWSPDGNRITYSQGLGASSEIYAINSNGTNAVQLTSNAYTDLVPSWQPLQVGTIIITKQAAPADDTVFTFTDSVVAPNTFTLSDPTTSSTTFSNISSGTYTVTEQALPSWVLHDITCDDANSTGDTSTGVASIRVEGGETVTCTFDNVKTDTIDIRAKTVGGDGTFSFTTSSLPGGNFDLTTSNTYANRDFTGLTPGTYDLTYIANSGWIAVEADPICSNGDHASNITIGVGEKVVCTFQFLQEDTITIVKNTIGHDHTFDFTGDLGPFSLTTRNNTASTSFTGLSAGTYSISETTLPGWSLTTATCDNGDTPDSVTVGTGEHVTCTFTNTKLGMISVVKLTDKRDDSFQFTSTIPGFTSFSVDTTGTTGSQSFLNLQPDVYSVQELEKSGWTLDTITCSDGSSSNSIDLAAGEEIICVFSNSKDFSWSMFSAPMNHGHRTGSRN